MNQSNSAIQNFINAVSNMKQRDGLTVKNEITVILHDDPVINDIRYPENRYHTPFSLTRGDLRIPLQVLF
ncbi:MAG TPA: hypothetical protein PK957_01765 [Candidatus Dojkabacteria bacterium]|nr:hypothetical protein [Candidatus Dojkabacteria bacterium]HQF36047.1 hypothetical protein [Candidatus Dojkabacteria bacterium]